MLFTSACAGTTKIDNGLTRKLPSSDRATITVKRSGSWVGGAVPAVIQDGTTKIGNLGPSGELTWSREPGYIALVTSGLHVLIFPVEEGKSYVLSTRLIGGWGFYCEPKNFDREMIVYESKAESQREGLSDDWKREHCKWTLHAGVNYDMAHVGSKSYQTDKSKATSNANNSFKLGMKQYKDKNYTGAVLSFTDSINSGCGNSCDSFYQMRALSYFYLGNQQASIADYNEAIVINPNKYYDLRAMAKVEAGEYTSAISDYNEAICIDPDDKRNYELRGIAKEKAGEYSSALSDFTEALKREDKDQVKSRIKNHIANVSEDINAMKTPVGIEMHKKRVEGWAQLREGMSREEVALLMPGPYPPYVTGGENGAPLIEHKSALRFDYKYNSATQRYELASWSCTKKQMYPELFPNEIQARTIESGQ